MTTFTVKENDKPATLTSVAPGEWGNADFNTFSEALEYAKQWLGQWASTIPENWDGAPYDYSGYGDMISITPRKP